MAFLKEDIELLKSAVAEKYGRPIGTAGECKLFAEEIGKVVGKVSISQKTVQRLWQQGHTNLSRAVMDILAKYVGYDDFYSAIEALKEKSAPYKYYSHSLSVGKYKLHDAMIIVLNQNNYEMTPEALADSINAQDLYERNDRQPLPASQILQRVGIKPKYFSYNKETNLVSLNMAHRKPEEN
ncbi:MAG: hypothetical protein IK117_06305 [Bacteroidales bacterium]|nr:hypothetical protein [Bacteroidales bacterium]